MEPSNPATVSIEQEIEEAWSSVWAGAPRDGIERLEAADRRTPCARLEEELVRLRHAAMGPASAPRPSAGSVGRISEPVPPPMGEGVPEVHRDELTAERLASALQHRGFLLVRELVPRTVAVELCELVKRSFDAETSARTEQGPPDTSPWYVPFEAHESYDFGDMERAFARYGDGLLTVESPRTLQRVIEVLRAAGIGELLQEYFGEWPVLSAKKSTLRSAGPRSLAGWHQDGAFLGTDIKTVNTWLALTPCGVHAPSIDLVSRSFDRLVETGTHDAHWSWSVGQSVIDGMGTATVVRPVFEPGDALLFNQFSLHRTGVDPAMDQDRIAIESWFFAPSTYPTAQIPLMF